jgi:hypothetical protein
MGANTWLPEVHAQWKRARQHGQLTGRMRASRRLNAQIVVATTESLVHPLVMSPTPVELQQLEDEIVIMLSRCLNRLDPSPPRTESGGGTTGSAAELREITELLRKLGELRDNGVLTDNEFVEQKECLLGGH